MRALHDVDFSLWQGKNRRKSAVYTQLATVWPRILRLFLTQPQRTKSSGMILNVSPEGVRHKDMPNKRCFVQSSHYV